MDVLGLVPDAGQGWDFQDNDHEDIFLEFAFSERGRTRRSIIFTWQYVVEDSGS